MPINDWLLLSVFQIGLFASDRSSVLIGSLDHPFLAHTTVNEKSQEEGCTVLKKIKNRKRKQERDRQNERKTQTRPQRQNKSACISLSLLLRCGVALATRPGIPSMRMTEYVFTISLNNQGSGAKSGCPSPPFANVHRLLLRVSAFTLFYFLIILNLNWRFYFLVIVVYWRTRS